MYFHDPVFKLRFSWKEKPWAKMKIKPREKIAKRFKWIKEINSNFIIRWRKKYNVARIWKWNQLEERNFTRLTKNKFMSSLILFVSFTCQHKRRGNKWFFHLLYLYHCPLMKHRGDSQMLTYIWWNSTLFTSEWCSIQVVRTIW